MQKYTKPELRISRFCVDDIITDSGALAPSTASGYVSADNNVSIADTTYIIDWNNQE